MLLIVVGCVAFGSSRAASVDFRTYTCGAYLAFIDASMEERDGLTKTTAAVQMSWIYGYISGEHGSSVMDAQGFSRFMSSLGTKCKAKPDLRLIDAAEESWSETTGK
jgi:hypothetical protein